MNNYDDSSGYSANSRNSRNSGNDVINNNRAGREGERDRDREREGVGILVHHIVVVMKHQQL